MASMTQTSLKPVVRTKVQMFEAEKERKRAADEASRVEKQKQADEREAEIRRNSELAAQLRRTPISAIETNEESAASSPPTPRRRKQDTAELDGNPPPSSSGFHGHEDLYSNDDIPRPPPQSRITSLPATNIARIQALESQLKAQNTRIQELEASREDLAQQVADLQRRRGDAERQLERAIAAGTEEKKRYEEEVAGLRRELEAVKKERNKAEREAEELYHTVGELRKELDKERREMSAVKEEALPLERSGDVVALPAAAASTADVSRRRGSVGESERRRRGHRRSHSNGSSISIGVKWTWGEDKDGKKDKGSSSRK
jgi:DNA repair exonuclease SbcCD ATPase subunit